MGFNLFSPKGGIVLAASSARSLTSMSLRRVEVLGVYLASSLLLEYQLSPTSQGSCALGLEVCKKVVQGRTNKPPKSCTERSKGSCET